MKQWRNNLLGQIEASGILQSVQRIKCENSIFLQGTTEIDDHKVTLLVSIAPLFYNRLPMFILQPWDALGFIPHVDQSGLICFLEQEGLIFDRQRPFEVVQECFHHVRRTLEQGLRGENHFDFVDEFEVYWTRLESNFALTDIDPTTIVTELLVFKSDNAKPALRIAHDVHSMRHIPNNQRDQGSWYMSRAIVLPLENGTLLIPPRSDQPFWSLDTIRSLKKYCSSENQKQLEILLQRPPQKTEYLIVQLPRPEGGNALFGVSFEGIQAQHPLLETGTVEHIRPIGIIRRDRAYLVQRGGGNVDLEHNHVLLIGCGAVGGHIAFELARAGVGTLTLIDHDTLTDENTYRHVLGKRYWDENKAEALKLAIEQNLPFSQVHTNSKTVEEVVASSTFDILEYDLIISAIGNPTSELALNERTRKKQGAPPIIFTWLDPYGIGGHAVLTGMPNDSGCFECLYTPAKSSSVDELEQLVNRASFAAPHQVFRRSLAGCYSLHTPYGSLDAHQTAQIATRLALDVLLEHQTTNEIRSWKGSSVAFEAAGFKLSSRYDLSCDELDQQRSAYANRTCRICSAKRSV